MVGGPAWGEAMGGWTVWMIPDGERGEFKDTRATAVQAVPHIAEPAKEFYVFSGFRRSSTPRGNGATGVEWWTSLTEGWQALQHPRPR